MKPTDPTDSDPSLVGLLKEWKVDASLPPRFPERVWQRIARAETETRANVSWFELARRLQTLLTRPATAAAYVAALLVLGFSLGLAQGFEQSARMERALSTRYVQAIDPYRNLGQ